MKDPTRIDNIVELFRKAWSICSDLSFEKFYLDKLRPHIGDRAHAFDMKFVTILEKFIETKGTMMSQEDIAREQAQEREYAEMQRRQFFRRAQIIQDSPQGSQLFNPGRVYINSSGTTGTGIDIDSNVINIEQQRIIPSELD